MSTEKKKFNYLRFIKILNRVLICLCVGILFAGITMSGIKQEKLKYNYKQSDISITVLQKTTSAPVSLSLQVKNKGKQTITSIRVKMTMKSTVSEKDSVTANMDLSFKALEKGETEKTNVKLDTTNSKIISAASTKIEYEFQIIRIEFEDGPVLYFDEDGKSSLSS